MASTWQVCTLPHPHLRKASIASTHSNSRSDLFLYQLIAFARLPLISCPIVTRNLTCRLRALRRGNSYPGWAKQSRLPLASSAPLRDHDATNRQTST